MKLIEFTQFLLRGVSPSIMIAFILSHLMFQGEFFSRKAGLKDKLYLTLIFGLMSSLGSLFAIYARNIYIDTAALVVIVAGLKGGVGVGLGAGILGALFRFLTFPEAVKFLPVTIVAGLLGGIASYVAEDDDTDVKMSEGFLIGSMVGLLQTIIIPMAAPAGSMPRASLLPLAIPLLLVNGFAVCTYLYIMKTLNAWNEKQKAEELRAKAQLKLLQSQIKPHFLFNALNTIASFSRKNPDRTRLLIQSLSEFLRVTLKTNRSNISLEEELENLEFYVEIEKARFGERLEFNEDVSDDILNIQVPFLSLQPLVENAIKHGFKADGSKLVINLKGQKNNDKINIEVEDNGKGIEAEKLDLLMDLEKERSGIGFQNSLKRMKNMYGEETEIDVKSAPDEGTSIKFSIPLKLPEGKVK